jgi:hypothetical protein
MTVLPALLSAVPVPFIRARFHVAAAATAATPAVQPDTERRPPAPKSWLVRFLWGRAGTPEEEAARAEALAIQARNFNRWDWRGF